MTEKTITPFGMWPSPISPAMQGARLRLEDVQFNSDGGLLWLEALSGKTSLMYKKGMDAAREISGGLKISAGIGYGGGDFSVRADQAVFVSGNRLHCACLNGGMPKPITPVFGSCASPAISPDGARVLFIHTYERADCLAITNINGGIWPVKLAEGADFYMHPTWHPDNQRIAWVEWNHPQMPWDGSRLMLASLNNNVLENTRQIFGSTDIPVSQPVFSPDGRYLAFLSNDHEWDSLYIYDLHTAELRALIQNVSLMEPAWVQGIHSIAWNIHSGCIYFLKNEKGWRSLWSIDIHSGEAQQLNTNPYTWISQLAASPASDSLAFIGTSPKISARIIITENGQQRIEQRSASENIPEDTLPEPRPIEWLASDGTSVHAIYYPPTSEKYQGTGLPPAIVNIHGGPTSARVSSYNPDAVYFATRGYAYLEVNYRGSTGYGRSYMLMLRNNWGRLDTEDAAGAAKALSDLGLADPQRIVIMGGSSGGYTVLNALIHYPGIFKAGINLFGVASLFDLLTDTHKFEERYTDSLVGTLPEASDRFKAWSPVFHAAQIKDPMAVFQGEDDKVVVPGHSEQIVSALRANKIPHIYRLYPGEGHGFRKTETIIDYYESLEKFLKQYVLF